LSRQIIVYAKCLKNHLSRLSRFGLEGTLFEIEGNENDKSIESYLKIIDFLIEKDFKKSDLLVGVGGGSVLDIVGFVAATFMRGVDVVFVPTTLLAMVDASIGGKNGINRPWVKNILGTNYLPKKTFLDMYFLSLMSPEELYPGYVEMIKVVIIDAFCSINPTEEDLKRQYSGSFLDDWEFPPTERSIERARALKQGIVEKDFQEKGLRKLLNFGHTVGHALEAYLEFTMSHGEAVQHGMSVEMELLEFPLQLRQKIASYFPFKTPFPAIDRENFLKILFRDKKNVENKIALSNVLNHKHQDYVAYFDADTVINVCLKRAHDSLYPRT
jgi:3-dehydroquinate synthase